MANVAVLTKSNELILPPFDKTVPGTTAIKCLKYIEANLMPSMVTSIRREMVNCEQLKSEAKEVLILGGQKVLPVLKWDDSVICETPGALVRELQKFLKDIESDSELLTEFK